MNRRCAYFVLVVASSIVFISSVYAQVGRGAFGFGLSVDGNMLQSDWKTNDPGIGASADLSYSLGHNWGLVSRLGVDTYYGKSKANENVLSTSFRGDLSLSYDFLRSKPLNPFVFVGAGFVFYYPRIDGGAVLTSGKYQPWDMALNGGLGFDCYINESWSIVLTGEATMMGNDQIDGYKAGGSNDIIGRVSLGIRYYLFDRSTVEQIVKTVE
jgi:hypothetical protein